MLPSLGTGVQWLDAISPGGAYLAVRCLDRRSVVWDVQKQQPIITNLFGGVKADFGAEGKQSLSVARTGNSGDSA